MYFVTVLILSNIKWSRIRRCGFYSFNSFDRLACSSAPKFIMRPIHPSACVLQVLPPRGLMLLVSYLPCGT